MAEEPSQQPTPPSSTSTAAELALKPTYDLAHLDKLLERYLNLLDTFTTLRHDLSQNLSSGFFSLAQAQRSSMLPPGQRYGEDMYDQTHESRPAGEGTNEPKRYKWGCNATVGGLPVPGDGDRTISAEVNASTDDDPRHGGCRTRR